MDVDLSGPGRPLAAQRPGEEDTTSEASGGGADSQREQPYVQDTRRAAHRCDTTGPVYKARDILKKSALANKEDIIERKVMKEVLIASKRRWANCMMLPVMWFFFIFYALAASKIEEPIFRHLVESPIREALMPILEEDDAPTPTMLQGVTTVPDVWNFIDNTFIPLFFAHSDSLNRPLPEDEWGTMFQYNQVLGAVKMETQRAVAKNCDEVASGTSKLPTCLSGTCEPAKRNHMTCYSTKYLDGENFGVPWEKVPNKTDGLTAEQYYLGEGLAGGPDEILSCESEAFTTGGCDSTSRQLSYLREDLEWFLSHSWFLADVREDAPTFSMLLDARDSLAKIKARVQYLQDRVWLDEASTALKLTVLYLNKHISSPHIVQVQISFQFSRGGGVFTYLDMTSFATDFWGSAGNAQVFAGLFLGSLLISTISVGHLVRAARRDRDYKIFLNWANFVALLSVVLGWSTIVLYLAKMGKLETFKNAIKQYNDASAQDTSSVLELHATAQSMVDLLYRIRTFIALCVIIFMCRAFVSLQFQPRLAVVIKTLQETSSDMFHFMIILISTVVAFALSGFVLYGKRLQDFSTAWAAIMTCFKIMMENEFKWMELSQDDLVPSILWTGAYLWLAVILLLNMVLAIIMDVYQEVRQESGESMTMLADAIYLYRNFLYRKFWIKERTIIETLDDMPEIITLEDLRERFPEMHQYQLDYIITNCRNKAKVISRVGILPGETAEMVAAIHISLEEVLRDLHAMKQSGWMCKGLEVGNDNDREHVKDILTSVAVQSHWMNLAQQHIGNLKSQVIGEASHADGTKDKNGVDDSAVTTLTGSHKQL